MPRARPLRGNLPRVLATAALFLLASVAPSLEAPAQQISSDVAARLTPAQQRQYADYLRARSAFNAELQAYWIAVDQKRDERKRKRATSQPFAPSDYIAEQPPKYTGPALNPEISKIIAEVQPPTPDAPKPGVADFLANARSQFGFVPTRVPERQFKLRYAEEALALGLSKAQVVRVYALETGGRGTHDMQAGIDPDTKKGTTISSALGYAQLLNANSVSELVKHGDAFIVRLNAMANLPNQSARRVAELRQKVIVLRKMQRAARSVPNEWKSHVQFGNTPAGLGIHALNLDADIGPWLQVIKLRGLKEDAERAGRPTLTGGEIELMNLAGPRTGLEMMEPVARSMPTANFFSQGGYYRNTIVREKTAAELLTALNQRMDVQIHKPGAVEFAAVFDEVAKRYAEPAPQR